MDSYQTWRGQNFELWRNICTHRKTMHILSPNIEAFEILKANIEASIVAQWVKQLLGTTKSHIGMHEFMYLLCFQF